MSTKMFGKETEIGRWQSYSTRELRLFCLCTGDSSHPGQTLSSAFWWQGGRPLLSHSGSIHSTLLILKHSVATVSACSPGKSRESVFRQQIFRM